MRIFSVLAILCFVQIACQTDNVKQTAQQPKTETAPVKVTEGSTPSKAVEAQKQGKASASTLQNLSTGFWHVGGAVNTSEGGKGYDGEWIQFAKDQTYIFGKDEKELSFGVWVFDEKNEYISLKDEKNPEAYFAHEYKCKQMGDIILLLGNTPNNKMGTQIKLVRQDSKMIEHNPN